MMVDRKPGYSRYGYRNRIAALITVIGLSLKYFVKRFLGLSVGKAATVPATLLDVNWVEKDVEDKASGIEGFRCHY
jgi:hypothetical protein